LIPDAPYHAISLGVGLERGEWEIDAALILSWREERTVSGSMPSPISPVPVTSDGDWNTRAVGLHLGLTRHF
jgi:hypothetical protein